MVVAIKRSVTFWLRRLSQTPLLDVANHSNHLLPGTGGTAALGIELPKRTLIRPENASHLCIDDSGINHFVSLFRVRLAVLEKFQRAQIEFKRLLQIFISEVTSLQQWNAHRVKIPGSNGMSFHKDVFPLRGRITPQLHKAIGPAFEGDAVTDG